MPANAEQLDSRVRVVTPENIAFEYRAAGPFTRLGAYLIDVAVQLLVIVGSIVLMIVFVLAVISSMVSGNITASSILGNLGAFSIFALWFAMQWFYGTLFELWWNGQTPGKRALGLRVLQIDGRPINVHQAVLRNIVRVIDAWPALPASASLFGALMYISPIAFSTHLLGLTAAGLTRRHQRLGDLVCGTMVVAEDRSFVGKVEPIQDPEIATLQQALPADYTPSRTLAKALAHYIGRRRYFGPQRRKEIAGHVGKVLIHQLALPADTDCDLLMCALYNRAFAEQEEHLLELAEEPVAGPSGEPPAATPTGTDIGFFHDPFQTTPPAARQEATPPPEQPSPSA